MTRALSVLLFFLATPAFANVDAYLQRLHQRLTGVPLLLGSADHKAMAAAISKGDHYAVAKIAQNRREFINIVVRDWAAAMGNPDESPVVTLNDFTTLFMGIVRDDIDARELLTGNYRYEGPPSITSPPGSLISNYHYLTLDDQTGGDLRDVLVKHSPQFDAIKDAAGALTTYEWSRLHYTAGTNRKGVQYAFQQFLCSPIEKWRDNSVPDGRVRRDVDRMPGGNLETYQTQCRSCHAPMDGMGGAFARLDVVGVTLSESQGLIPKKMNQNAGVYPEGFFTTDTTWVNYATENHNKAFGWRGKLEGNNLNDFGRMLANAEGFSRCLTQKVFAKVCRRKPEPLEMGLVSELASDFEKDNYNLKHLFAKVAARQECLAHP